MDDSTAIIGELATQSGLFLEHEECQTVAKALEGQALTVESVAGAVSALTSTGSGYVA